MSLIVFTGASQFAAVGVLTAGGSAAAAIATGLLLASRNLVYGISIGKLLNSAWLPRTVAAHLVVDETTAMAISQREPSHGRAAFWITAVSEFTLWNLGTLAGALSGEALADPKSLGLDAAFPATFIALALPQLRAITSWTLAILSGTVALLLVTVTPPGIPVLATALIVGGVSMSRSLSFDRINR